MGRDGLCRQLGHAFHDRALLEQALTHRSAAGAHNERLEFLGDAVLSFLIAEALYRRFPRAREGELTRLRAALVKGATLAAVARELDLGQCLLLGGGERKSGGRHRDSILADALEAVLGAVYLDGGMDACRAVIGKLYARRLDSLSPARASKDPKTRLQEWLQARRRPLPIYTMLTVEGDDHAQHFTVACALADADVTVQGQGASRRKAEQDAASRALDLLDGA